MFELETSPSSLAIIDKFEKTYKEANPYRYSQPEKYLEILNQAYNEEANRRLRLLCLINDNKDYMQSSLVHMSKREHIIDWIVDWCWTYDPRLATVGLPTMIPMVPFYRQVEFVQWMYERYLAQERGVIEKSRDAGATWFAVTVMTFEWRWTDGFAGGIGSNKLDNVDDRDNPDCIFEKIRTLIRLLPPFWMPKDYIPRKHEKVGNLFNPEMGSYITGQGGKEIGRGGRRSMYLVDEAASLEFPLKTDASLSANTNCQLDLSTPKGMNHFGQKRHSGNLPVFTFHWTSDPRKDDEWFQVQKKTLDPVVLAQEVLINYHASVEGLFIKPEWIDAAVKIKLKPTDESGAGLDVAAGGKNKSSLCIRFGPVCNVTTFDYDNGSDLVHTSIDLCNQAGVGYLNYDNPGVGFAVKSVINRTEKVINFPHYGMEPGGAKSDLYYEEFKKLAIDIFVNARAEWWYGLEVRFKKTYEHVMGIQSHPEDEMISIPNNPNLKAQLASPKKMYTETGKIKCESKEAMLKRGIQSPDEADALALACIPKAGGQKHIVGGMNDSFLDSLNINWNQPEFKTRNLAGVVIDKDMSISGLCAVYDEEQNKLYVHSEISVDHIDPDKTSRELIHKMHLKKYTADKIIGNAVMFQEFKKTFQKELNRRLWAELSSFQTVSIKPPRRYDAIGSLSVLLNMVNSKTIIIDKKCMNTYNQFISWKLERGKVEFSGMREAILLIISELMTYEPFIKKAMKVPEYSKTLGGVKKEITSNGDPLGV